MFPAQDNRSRSVPSKKAIRPTGQSLKRKVQDNALQALLQLIERNNGQMGCHFISKVVKAYKHPAVTYHTIQYRLKCYRIDQSKKKIAIGGVPAVAKAVAPEYVNVSDMNDNDNRSVDESALSDDFDSSSISSVVSATYKNCTLKAHGNDTCTPTSSCCRSSASTLSSDSSLSSISTSSSAEDHEQLLHFMMLWWIWQTFIRK